MLAKQPVVASSSSPSIADPTSGPRKRRRKPLATGASEDCFTCQANSTKCDRRRPYCGPCLEIGTTCNGYRTQLTWGFGVASRGKLRGMTLPISIEPNTSVAPEEQQSTYAASLKKKSTSIDELYTKPKKLKPAFKAARCDKENIESLSGMGKLNIVTNYDFVNMEHPTSSIPQPASNVSREIVMSSERHQNLQGSSTLPCSMGFTDNSSSLLKIPTPSDSFDVPDAHHQRHRHEYPSTAFQFRKSAYTQRPQVPHTVPDFNRAYSSSNVAPYVLSPSPDYPLLDFAPASQYSSPITTMDVASSVTSYPSLAASFQYPHLIQSDNSYWSTVGISNFHPQSEVAVTGNPSDVFYGHDMLDAL